MPTSGYVYFHKIGADTASHNAAVEGCAQVASQSVSPMIPVPGGLLGALIIGHENDSMANVTFVANVENCMVVKGWDVVKLDDAEGKRIAGLDEVTKAATLAPWIGAETPTGSIVRRYQPLREAVAGGIRIGDFGDRARNSLSVASDLSNIMQTRTRPFDPKWAEKWVHDMDQADYKKVPDGATAIVVRGLCAKGCGWMRFILLLDPSNPAQPPHDVVYELPTRFLNATVLDETHVFLVPPGHWRMGSLGGFNLCMGGPAFDIAPGEAVFIGTFDGRKLYDAPDLDVTPAKQALGDTGIARRLKPANYVNGGSFSCDASTMPIIYVQEYLGLPFEKDYALGSRAATAPDAKP